MSQRRGRESGESQQWIHFSVPRDEAVRLQRARAPTPPAPRMEKTRIREAPNRFSRSSFLESNFGEANGTVSYIGFQEADRVKSSLDWRKSKAQVRPSFYLLPRYRPYLSASSVHDQPACSAVSRSSRMDV